MLFVLSEKLGNGKSQGEWTKASEWTNVKLWKKWARRPPPGLTLSHTGTAGTPPEKQMGGRKDVRWHELKREREREDIKRTTRGASSPPPPQPKRKKEGNMKPCKRKERRVPACWVSLCLFQDYPQCKSGLSSRCIIWEKARRWVAGKDSKSSPRFWDSS